MWGNFFPYNRKDKEQIFMVFWLILFSSYFYCGLIKKMKQFLGIHFDEFDDCNKT